MKILRNRGTNLNYQNKLGETALAIASDHDYEAVVYLLSRNVDVNLPDLNNQTPLMRASFYGEADIVEALLNKGATVNNQDVNGLTALMKSAIRSEGNLKVFGLLLANGADVNLQDNKGETALSYACAIFHTEVAVFLINNGADYNLKNINGFSAWEIAHDNAEVIALIEHKELTKVSYNQESDLPIGLYPPLPRSKLSLHYIVLLKFSLIKVSLNSLLLLFIFTVI